MSLKNKESQQLVEAFEQLPTDMRANVLSQLVDDLPEEQVKSIFMSREQRIQIRGNGELPIIPFIMDKLTDEHITKVLENQSQDQNNRKDLTQQDINNKFILIMVSIFIGFLILVGFGFMLWLFKEKENLSTLIADIFKYLIGAVCGFSAGFGIKNNKPN